MAMKNPPFIDDVPIYNLHLQGKNKVFSMFPRHCNVVLVETRAPESGPCWTSLCSCHFRKWSLPHPPRNAKLCAPGVTRPALALLVAADAGRSFESWFANNDCHLDDCLHHDNEDNDDDDDDEDDRGDGDGDGDDGDGDDDGDDDDDGDGDGDGDGNGDGDECECECKRESESESEVTRIL